MPPQYKKEIPENYIRPETDDPTVHQTSHEAPSQPAEINPALIGEQSHPQPVDTPGAESAVISINRAAERQASTAETAETAETIRRLEDERDQIEARARKRYDKAKEKLDFWLAKLNEARESNDYKQESQAALRAYELEHDFKMAEKVVALANQSIEKIDAALEALRGLDQVQYDPVERLAA